MEDMKRVFAAVELPEELLSAAERYNANLKRRFPELRVSWETRPKLHLTLRFFGNLTTGQCESALRAMRGTAAETPPFRLKIGNAGAFRRKGLAKVLWLGTEDLDGGLVSLRSRLEDHLADAGFAKEARAYKPHLTVVRLREPGRSGDLVKAHLDDRFEPVEAKITEVALIESVLLPVGSRYSVIKTFSFSTA